MTIKTVKESIKKKELIELASEEFGDAVKAVVDVEQEIMVVGGELHADEETLLLEQEGSKRENIWGINIYPNEPKEKWIEFNSMINIKPSLGNRSRGVEDQGLQEKIKNIVKKLIPD